MTQAYDVAVIGAEPAGVITAALLAKRGRRVVLVDNGEDTTVYKRRGLRLPLSPSLIPAFLDSPPVRRVHQELGVSPELRTQSYSPTPPFQAVMPQHRVAILSDREALFAEIAAEFPDVAKAAANFFATIDQLNAEIDAFLTETLPVRPSTFFERLGQARALSRVAHLALPFESHRAWAGIPADHPVRDLLLTPLNFFGHLAPEQPSTFQAVRLISSYFRGLVRFYDPLGGLSSFLWRAAREAGVDVHRGATIEDLVVKGRRLERFTLSDSSDECRADYFVANTLSSFQALLPATQKSSRYALEEQAVQPAGTLLVMNLVVDKDVIPCGMGEHVIVLNGRRQARDGEPVDPPVLLNRLPAQGSESRKDGAIDERHEILSVACPVRTDDVEHTPARLAGLRAQLFERVARVIPFLRENLRDASLPSESSTWDIETDAPMRRVDPWRLHPLFQTGAPPLLGVAARPVRTYYKNLVRTGRDIVPGLGIEGEYMSGLLGAQALAKIAGKRWQLPR
jgi:phytoene dehydrogenase-like protein